jgi:hypothetical protein
MLSPLFATFTPHSAQARTFDFSVSDDAGVLYLRVFLGGEYRSVFLDARLATRLLDLAGAPVDGLDDFLRLPLTGFGATKALSASRSTTNFSTVGVGEDGFGGETNRRNSIDESSNSFESGSSS